MAWQKHDVPDCCGAAAWLITWMPKGLKMPQPNDHGLYGNKQFGPKKTGWAVYIEAGGPGCPSHYVNVTHCPFCGKELSELEAPDGGKRSS